MEKLPDASPEAPEDAREDAQELEEDSAGIDVDEGLFNVEITIAAALFESMTEDDDLSQFDVYIDAAVYSEAGSLYTLPQIERTAQKEPLIGRYEVLSGVALSERTTPVFNWMCA